MDEQDEIIQEFLIEGREGLDHLDQELVKLEEDPTNPERLAGIFRTIHSLKGTSGFLGFSKLESISHIGETLLSNMRDGTVEFDRAVADALLSLVDASRSILENISSNGHEGDENYDALLVQLVRLADSSKLQGSLRSAPPAAPRSILPLPRLAQNIERDDDDVELHAPPTPRSSGKKEPAVDFTIRVDVALLDRLMNLVGELVLSRNQILQHSSRWENAAFLATSQRLNHITTELQEGLMKTRMQPIKSVWAKFPRVVRDLSRICEKDVQMDMDGEDTELDRTIIEAIKDPMTHIVRNSVDHGIETPEERRSKGKPRQGRLALRAYHEGGKVNIEISDDGRGLDTKRLREKAVEKGVASAAQVATMTEREAMQLVFAPGFSTAATITQVSGRGVGMDVVKTNIERIGGTIDLTSRVNAGTTIKIKIPLTLAIIPALIVDSAGDSYAIPQVNLLELVRFEPGQAMSSIEHVHGAPVCRLRGNLLPLVYLHDILGLAPLARADEAINIVVLQADDRHFGLVVDRVCDTEEIVVKPLGKELKSVGIFAGATIMGDGRVALILDVLGVAHAGRLTTQERDRRLRHVGATDRDSKKLYTMLVFKINERERGAVPLKAVARLEEIPQERIEYSGGDEVVQYRGEIMPLIRMASALGKAPQPKANVEQVLVFQRRQKSVGIIVDTIEDVVEESLEVHRPLSRPFVKGQAVLQGKITELVDLPDLIEAMFPGFFAVTAAE